MLNYLWSKRLEGHGYYVRCFNLYGALATFGLSTGRTKVRKTNNNQNNEETNSLLALLSPAVARAITVTPQFTTGSMNSITTTTQTIVETEQVQVYGAQTLGLVLILQHQRVLALLVVMQYLQLLTTHYHGV